MSVRSLDPATIQRAYRLIHELCEAGSDTRVWRERFMSAVEEMTHAQMSISYRFAFSLDTEPPARSALWHSARRKPKKTIAEKMGVSANSVHTCERALFERAGVTGRGELLAKQALSENPMASRWAGKGVDARRSDEAVFRRYSEERQRSSHALSGPAKPAQNRLICAMRDGSKGPLTQLSPSLLVSEPILCCREAIGFLDRA